MPTTVALREGVPEPFGLDALPMEAALALSRSRHFAVEWGGPNTGYRTLVTSRGWVGHIPVTPEFMVRVTPKVPVRRIFDLLEVAYNLKSFRLLEGDTQIETMEGLVERLASILAKRVLDRARRGLYGGYLEETAELPAIRGRINALGTVRSFLRGGTSVHCTYDGHSRDLDDNRILLWTLHEVSRLEELRVEVRREVRDAYRAVRGLVTLVPCLPRDCLSRLYNRLNDDYQPMHGLCRLLLEHMGPGIQGGEHGFIPFMLNMPSLFEMFTARWLAAHLPANLKVHTQLRAKLDASAALEVRIDIVLRDTATGANLAVLDTKYKEATEPSMADIQQAAFYANEMNVERAFLVYPSTETTTMWVRNGGVTIHALVFDLDRPPLEAGREFLRALTQRLLPTPLR